MTLPPLCEKVHLIVLNVCLLCTSYSKNTFLKNIMRWRDWHPGVNQTASEWLWTSLHPLSSTRPQWASLRTWPWLITFKPKLKKPELLKPSETTEKIQGFPWNPGNGDQGCRKHIDCIASWYSKQLRVVKPFPECCAQLNVSRASGHSLQIRKRSILQVHFMKYT